MPKGTGLMTKLYIHFDNKSVPQWRVNERDARGAKPVTGWFASREEAQAALRARIITEYEHEIAALFRQEG
jgi:hypothetical protein